MKKTLLISLLMIISANLLCSIQEQIDLLQKTSTDLSSFEFFPSKENLNSYTVKFQEDIKPLKIENRQFYQILYKAIDDLKNSEKMKEHEDKIQKIKDAINNEIEQLKQIPNLEKLNKELNKFGTQKEFLLLQKDEVSQLLTQIQDVLEILKNKPNPYRFYDTVLASIEAALKEKNEYHLKITKQNLHQILQDLQIFALLNKNWVPGLKENLFNNIKVLEKTIKKSRFKKNTEIITILKKIKDDLEIVPSAQAMLKNELLELINKALNATNEKDIKMLVYQIQQSITPFVHGNDKISDLQQEITDQKIQKSALKELKSELQKITPKKSITHEKLIYEITLELGENPELSDELRKELEPKPTSNPAELRKKLQKLHQQLTKLIEDEKNQATSASVVERMVKKITG